MVIQRLTAPLTIDKYQLSLVIDLEPKNRVVGRPGSVNSPGNPGFWAIFTQLRRIPLLDRAGRCSFDPPTRNASPASSSRQRLRNATAPRSISRKTVRLAAFRPWKATDAPFAAKTGRYLSLIRKRAQRPSISVIKHACKGSFSHAFLIRTNAAKNRSENQWRKQRRPVPSPAAKLRGYPGVSTEDELNDAQVDELRAAGCRRIPQEHGSGASRARPVLTKLLKDLSTGDVLVVVRLDRLARSISQLLDVIEDLERRGIHFRSFAIRSTPPRHRGCSRCRCSAPSPSSNVR